MAVGSNVGASPTTYLVDQLEITTVSTDSLFNRHTSRCYTYKQKMSKNWCSVPDENNKSKDRKFASSVYLLVFSFLKSTNTNNYIAFLSGSPAKVANFQTLV